VHTPRLTAILLPAALLAWLFSAPAAACSCAGGAPPVRFNLAQAVFVGQMLSGTERVAIQQGEDDFRFVEAGSVRFSVEEAFKGALGSEVTVQIASNSNNSCGPYGLQRGVRYLMYAYASEAEPTKFYSGPCSHSTTLDTRSALEDLEFLRNLPPIGTGGILQGRVMKNLRWEGRDGFPDFTVRLTGPEGKVTEVVTDREGNFRVTGLPPGKYRVEPQFPSGYGPEYDRTIEVSLADRGTAGIGIEAFTDGRVYGQMLDRAGRSYNRAFLMMEPEGVAPNWNSRVYGHSSGGEGAFQFLGVPPGRYRLYLEVRRADFKALRFTQQRYYYPGTFESSEATVITLGRAEKVRGLEYRLPEGFLVRTVEGTVVSPDGKPVANAYVGFHCVRSSRPERGVLETNVVYDVETDADGRFRLEAIGGTTYRLVARKYDTTRETYVHSGGVSLAVTQDVRNRQLVLSEVGEVGGCGEFVAAATKEMPVTRPKPAEVAGLIAELRQHIAAEKLIEPLGDCARSTLLRLRLLESPPPQVAELSRVVADSLLQKGRAALRASAYERSADLLRAARELGPVSDPAALEKAEADLRRAREITGR